MKRYPVRPRSFNNAVRLKNEKRRRRRTLLGVIFLLLLTIGATSYCVMFNVGPMNELACFYKGVHNPSYAEMNVFIKSDETNNNEYTDAYKCGSFSYDVIMHAKAQGIQAGYVTIWGKPDNHAIVVFKTSDNGIWFMEPQSDAIFTEAKMNEMLFNHHYYVAKNGGSIDLQMSSYSINWFFGLRT